MKPVRIISWLYLACVAAVSVVQAQSPPAPSELQASLSSDHHVVELRWQHPDVDPMSYNVYRKAGPDTGFSVVASPADHQYNDQDVQSGLTYFYKVTAVYSSGSGTAESDFSNTAQITTGSSGDSVNNDSSQAAVRITSDPVTQAQVGQPYQYSVQVSTTPAGATVCFQLHEGPPGMAIDSSTGELTWVPSAAGMFEVEVRARICPNGEDGADQRFNVSVFSGTAASLHGTATNDSGRGLAGIRIRLFDVASGNFLFRTVTDFSGMYSVPAINPSTYYLRASDEHSMYESQWYNNVTRLQDATPVTAGEGADVSVNFTLHRREQSGTSFTVSGTVRASSGGTPLVGHVTAFRADDSRHRDDEQTFDDHHEEDSHDGEAGSGHRWDDRLHGTTVRTDSAGGYRLQLNAGSYTISASADGFLTQFWDGKSSALEANILDLHQDTTDIDFSLDARPHGTGSITGIIRRAADSLPMAAHVVGFQRDSLGHTTGFLSSAQSDSNGAYTLGNLLAGNYVVLAMDHGHDVVPTFYDLSGGTPFLDSAAAVHVDSSPVGGIDIFVRVDSVDGLNEVEGEIETEHGGVTAATGQPAAANTASPVGGSLVVLKNLSGNIVGSGLSSGDGTYQVSGIPAGTYTIVFQKPDLVTTTVPVMVSYAGGMPTAVTVNAQMSSIPGAGIATSTFTLRPSWNLVSVPVAASGAGVADLFPNISSPGFAYSSGTGYQPASVLENGKGYWIRLPALQSVTMQGPARNADVIQLKAGWNLIGSLSVPVPVNTVGTGGLALSHFFGYDGGYQQASVLEPGKGYWVKSSADGSISLGGSGNAAKPSAGAADLRNMNSITIGNGSLAQTLYIGEQTAALRGTSFELPPRGPAAEMFDARFGSGSFVELYPAGMGSRRTFPIAVTSTGSEITIQWSVAPGNVRLTLVDDAGRIAPTPLTSGQGTIRLSTSGQQSGLKLVVEPASVPAAFSLLQNYPNPFNPSTTIAYQLAQDSRVVVKVFNLLGQEIGTLVDGFENAGQKSVRFDASTLPSGVYFFRLEARNAANSLVLFSQVRKMVLLK